MGTFGSQTLQRPSSYTPSNKKWLWYHSPKDGRKCTALGHSPLAGNTQCTEWKSYEVIWASPLGGISHNYSPSIQYSGLPTPFGQRHSTGHQDSFYKTTGQHLLHGNTIRTKSNLSTLYESWSNALNVSSHSHGSRDTSISKQGGIGPSGPPRRTTT